MGEVDLGPGVGDGRVDQGGQAVDRGEDVAGPQVAVHEARRACGEQLGQPVAQALQGCAVGGVERGRDPRLGQPSQQAVLREELVPVVGPRVDLTAAAEPVVLVPAEAVVSSGGVQVCEEVRQPLPERRRRRAWSQRGEHQQVRTLDDNVRRRHPRRAQDGEAFGLGGERTVQGTVERLHEQSRTVGAASQPSRGGLAAGGRIDGDDVGQSGLAEAGVEHVGHLPHGTHSGRTRPLRSECGA